MYRILQGTMRAFEARLRNGNPVLLGPFLHGSDNVLHLWISCVAQNLKDIS